MLIDTHAHLNFSAFDGDRGEVIQKSLGNNIWMIDVGCQYDGSKKAIETAEGYKEGVYAAVGIHPLDLKDTNSGAFDYNKYKTLAISSKKVVAIGEIGLDYWYKPVKKEQQIDALEQQLNLAEELSLPVIIHCRVAHNDLFEALQGRAVKGVLHCFTGSWEQAQQFLEIGFYIGFNGIIFKNLQLGEVVIKTPLERILLETDCPYLTPPSCGGKRNEPLFVQYIASEIARLREMDIDDLAKITTDNAKKLFKL